jgi:hypothetical protein
VLQRHAVHQRLLRHAGELRRYTRVVTSISRTTAFLLVSSLGVGACGVFGASDTETTPEPPPRVDAEAGTDAGADVAQMPADGAAADATLDAPPPPPCAPSAMVTETANSEADGLIAVSSTQLFGGLSICNAAVGRCLVRFPLSTAAKLAFGAKKVVAMTLTLRRADTDSNCGAGANSCVPLREPALLSVVPSRVDWDEAHMNWDVAKSGTNWGVAGAGQVGTDIGNLAGSVMLAASDLTPTVSLDPARWLDYDFLATSKLALRFEFLDGLARKQLVIVMHEQGALPHEPPKLSITYCP